MKADGRKVARRKCESKKYVCAWNAWSNESAVRADFFFLNLNRFSLSLTAVVGRIGIVLPYVIVGSSNLCLSEG